MRSLQEIAMISASTATQGYLSIRAPVQKQWVDNVRRLFWLKKKWIMNIKIIVGASYRFFRYLKNDY